MDIRTYFLVVLLIGGSLEDFSSKCAIQTGIKWYDVQAVFDALDPCTPNPCLKGQVCRISEDTYQHYCEDCEVKNSSNGSKECIHTSSFENLLLSCATGFYRALPWLRQTSHDKFKLCPNKEILTDVCDPNPCKNGGKCFSNQATHEYNCRCPASYSGISCEHKVIESKEILPDVCNPNPCKNGGTCFSNQATREYNCLCSALSSGRSCEYKAVFTEKNRIATGLKSSQHVDEITYPSTNALDENPGTFTHTKWPFKNGKPWWQIDLQSTYRILGVTLVNRKDCCGWRLHDFEIRVGNYSMPTDNTINVRNSLCNFHPGAGIPEGGSINIYCEPEAIVGRYLSVQIIRNCNQATLPDCATYGDMLTIATIRIYGDSVV